VIIPVFNRAGLLDEAVESTLGQEGAQLEVIVVDDCSTDSSLATARQIAAGHPEVLVASLPVNKGPSAARNCGLELASSPFVTFLDSDDLMTAGRLQRQLKELEQHPDCLVTGRQKIVVRKGVSPPDCIVAEMSRPETSYPMTMCGSRSTFDRIGEFNESYRLLEDLEFLVRAGELGIEIRRLDSVLITRRIMGDNAVTDTIGLSTARLRIFQEHHRRVGSGSGLGSSFTQ
jgi:glycosyltransferase involved in cell wall biosynthesis